MIQTRSSRLVLILIALAAHPALGQAFFGGGAIAFDPEVSVIQSGTILDAQPVVSDDRKYVTLNLRPRVSRPIALQQFPINAIVNQGFVGGVNLPSGNAVNFNAQPEEERPNRRSGARGNQNAAPSATPPSPDMIARSAKSWVFTRQGTYLVAPLP